jgi:hypothetical protein
MPPLGRRSAFAHRLSRSGTFGTRVTLSEIRNAFTANSAEMKTDSPHIKLLGVFPYHRDLRIQFRSGVLAAEWVKQYHSLFDHLDLEQAVNQAQHGYLFHEWFAAIMLHHATGYHALVAHYHFAKHARKMDIAKALLGPAAWQRGMEVIADFRAQPPDLLMYSPNRESWFFCEVKGPTDRLRPRQRECFEALAELTGQSVMVVALTEMPRLAEELSPIDMARPF